jgi:hypothetical protein
VSAIHKAKDTLLRALDQLERAERDLEGEAEQVHLIVTYELGREASDGAWHSIGGWAATSGPKWLHVALLERSAAAQREVDVAVDDFDDGEEGDGQDDGD